MTISIHTIATAIDLLSDQNSLSRKDIAKLYLSDQYRDELDALAALPNNVQDSIAISPETLDKADLFNLLSHPELIAEGQADAIQKIRVFLGLPQEDPAGVSLSFGLCVNSSGQTLAKTKVIPENHDTSLSPIVFAGGLFHKSSTYLPYMMELAKATGREVLLFDAPGVGGSVYNVKSMTHDILSASLPDVIKSEYPADKSVVVMGHSLGSITVRNLYHHQDLIPNPIEKFIAVCPVPAGAEQKSGLKFSLPFMTDGAVSMITRGGHIVPNKNSYGFFYQKHDKETQWPWLEERIANENFPARPFAYLNVLGQVSKQSFLDEGELGTDPRLKVILAEDDNVMKLTKSETITDKEGVSVVAGADHSFLADDEINPNYLDALVKSLSE